MKKIIVLALLLLAVPAMATSAGVTITVTDNHDKTATIGYVCSGTRARAFGLDITVSSGATITAVAAVSTSYTIYPGTIVIDTSGNITANGSPVAPASAKGALGGVGTSGVTIEMGSLYKMGVDPAPALSGTLVKITVDKDTCVTVAANSVRGGVVLEDVTTASLTSQGACLTSVKVCPGDFDGDGWITTDDLALMVSSLRPYKPDYAYVCPDPSNCPGDFDGDGWVTTDDLALMVAALRPYAPDYAYECQ